MKNIFFSLAIILSSFVFTAFGKTFHIFNTTGQPLWTYTYCNPGEAAQNKFRTEDALETGKKDHYMSDSMFLCLKINDVGFALEKGKPSLFIERGINNKDEIIHITKDDTGKLVVSLREVMWNRLSSEQIAGRVFASLAIVGLLTSGH
jgi:hypothetical protein